MLRTLRGMEFHKLVAAQQYCSYTGGRLQEKTCGIVIDDTGAFVTLVSPEAAHNIRWTPRLRAELAERGHHLLPGQGHDALNQDEPARRIRDAHPTTGGPDK